MDWKPIETAPKDGLQQRVEEMEAAGREMVSAWEILPEGRYGIATVQGWLIDNVKPAIDGIRAALSKEAAHDRG